MSYVGTRGVDLAELGEIYAVVLEEIRREVRRELDFVKEDDEGKEPDILEIIDEVANRDDPVGLPELLDALDAAGWELNRLGPRARVRSGSRGPRVKRIAGGGT